MIKMRGGKVGAFLLEWGRGPPRYGGKVLRSDSPLSELLPYTTHIQDFTSFVNQLTGLVHTLICSVPKRPYSRYELVALAVSKRRFHQDDTPIEAGICGG
jgi:hypothetical protein